MLKVIIQSSSERQSHSDIAVVLPITHCGGNTSITNLLMLKHVSINMSCFHNDIFIRQMKITAFAFSLMIEN